MPSRRPPTGDDRIDILPLSAGDKTAPGGVDDVALAVVRHDLQTQSRRRHVGLLLVGAPSLLAATAIYLVVDKRDSIWRSAHVSVRSLALGLEASSTALLEQSASSLSGLADDLHGAGGKEAALRNAMRFDPVSEFLGIVRHDRSAATLVAVGGRRPNRQVEDHVRQTLSLDTADGGFDVHPLLQLPGRPDWYLPLTLALDAERRDIAVALVPARRFTDAAHALAVVPGGTLAFTRLDGTRLFRFLPAENRLVVGGEPNPADWMAAALARTSGSAEVVQGPGGPRLVGYARSRLLPLFVSAVVPTASLNDQWTSDSVGPVLAIVAALLGVGHFGVRWRAALRKNDEYLAQLRHAADHDALTGLLTRDAFTRLLVQSLSTHRDRPFTVVLIDIRSFRDINDTLGHAAGDEVLRVTGARLRAQLHGFGVARLGGDELAVYAPRQDHAASLGALHRQIQGCLAQPVTSGGVELELGATMGASVYPEDATTATELLRCADIALHHGKADLKPFERYRAAMDSFTADSLALKAEFAQALRDGSLSLVFQPKVRLDDGRLVGVEALSRWVHPTKGPISPERFVPLAEHSELIHPFTEFVLAAALRQAVAWRGAGFVTAVSVNVSANNLGDPHFPDKVRALLAESGVEPGMLELELTESALMRNPDVMLQRLHALRDLGVTLSIDDFGTGYASMTYLKQLPVQAVKIDRSFVDKLELDPADQRIVHASVQLAHEFGMVVVAEGVETERAAEMLAAYGCDCAQGYLYDKPLSGAQLLERWGARCAA